ncbi:MAG: GNAT family N-acetyltransferase [Anaerolineaceae bacterium]|nr:GNAT family N-acetyltransferase [Anaerolineaceae bacterium]
MALYDILPLQPQDQAWVARVVCAQWGAEIVVAHGQVFDPARLPGFWAAHDEQCLGLATYQVSGVECELITLDSLVPGAGVGTALVEAVRQAARQAGCRRLHLITTNDNLNALHFYQKRGFRLAELHPGAIQAARRLKPSIPLLGEDGIPIRDELVLEMYLPEQD